MAILIHFLLVYDHAAGRLREERTYQDAEEAIAAYAKLEEKHRADTRVEIVLVGADSMATVRQTHGHYFDRNTTPVSVPIGEPRATASTH